MTADEVDQLGARIVAAAARIAAATCAWLLEVAAFDAAKGYLRFGLPCTGWWLSHHCGMSRRTANEHVRVARALAAHPRLTEEMAAGRLSYSQTRAISRAARPDEHELVEHLIEIAQHGTAAHLEQIVRGLRTVDDIESGAERVDRERVNHSWADDAMWRLSARLDPERGATVASAIEQVAAAEELSAADALVRLAEIGLAALAAAKRAPRRLRDDERAAVVVHLHAATDFAGPGSAEPATAPNASGSAEPNAGGPTDIEVCGPSPIRPYGRLARGPGLPAHVVKRLLCDGRVRVIAHDSKGSVLDVGRSHRLVTPRQRRAILTAFGNTCAYPGCLNSKNLHIHHVVHWLDGGATDIANLAPLCEPHHLGHHNGEYAITVLPNGRLRFTTADGRELTDNAEIEAPADAPAIDDEYASLDPAAPRTRWDGEKLDLRYAVGVLAQGRYRSRPESLE